MPYTELSAAANQTAIIDAIETALTGGGWTVDTSVPSPRKINFHRTIDGDDLHFSIQANSANSRLEIYAYTGAAEAGPSSAVYAYWPNTAVSTTIGILVQPESLYVLTSGARAFGLGRLTLTYAKAVGDVTGAFAWANTSSSLSEGTHGLAWTGVTNGQVVRMRTTAGNIWQTAVWHNFGSNSFSGSYQQSPLWYLAVYPSPSGIRPMLEISCFGRESPIPASGGQYYLVGRLPNLRMMSNDLVANGSAEVVGSDTWRRFHSINGNTALAALV